MRTYLHSIQIGVLLFFIFLFLSLIPYLIVQYRRYGRINFWRFFVNFSFILYLICAYAMTIFPLPPVNEVAQMTGPKQNLVPFEFIHQFILYSPFRINEPSTWILALKDSTFIQPFFNLLLTLPFGFYLKYLFKRSFKQTFILSFLLTLSFELIQRSALFGLYPRPYRLFDVDDLMINTLGSLIGFGIAVIFSRFLPDLDATKVESSRVSLSRRFIAFLVDMVLVFIIGSLFLPTGYYSELLILGIVPIALKATPGQLLLRIQIKGKNRFRIALRQFLSFGNFALIIASGFFLQRSGTIAEDQLAQNFLLILLFLGLSLLLLLDVLIAFLSKTRKLWYERVSDTQIVAKLKTGKE
ncbi:VanZ family protein [Lactococcus cremoris]|uniref:VanZ family protein n=1 Tax=Lactococcus lactis subsp. cremoris TaxID=1359 RepID=UPI0021A9F803|nr:VanZ family protein [Lactococcus cremoris]ARE18784.2 VanZ family protein [Lactococcus cremoris]MCT4462268.1 VanZ family protein [Lactococcus cremoris]